MPQSDKNFTSANESLGTKVPEESLWVICLCADWCGACRAYRGVFSQLAQELANTNSGYRFVWLDVEDQADLVGDLEIETFPTLLAGNDRGLSFLGAVTPQADVLRRLLKSLTEPEAGQMVHRPETLQIIDRLAGLPQLGLLQGGGLAG